MNELETKTQMNYEMYRDYYFFSMNKRHQFMIYCALTVIILVVLGLVIRQPILLVLAILFPVAYYYSLQMKIRTNYVSKKHIKDMVYHYRFHDHHFSIISENGKVSVDYEKIQEVIETKNYFFLMVEKGKGYIINKDACSLHLLSLLYNIKARIY